MGIFDTYSDIVSRSDEVSVCCRSPVMCPAVCDQVTSNSAYPLPNANAMALLNRCALFLAVLGESFAANHPLVIVPGLTGSALEVREHDAPMPHWFCKRDTKDKWMKVWVSPVPHWQESDKYIFYNP